MVVIVACFVGYVIVKIAPYERHRPVAEKMSVAVLRLSEDRPADLTDDQWAYCITWTWNLHSNYGLVHSYVSTRDLERIERELHARIDNGADLGTIDWIWDQYVQSYPRARHYNHFRPTSPENKESFEAGAHGGNSLSEWRAEYRRRAAELAKRE